MKNNDERDQSWRKELGLELEDEAKKIKKSNKNVNKDDGGDWYTNKNQPKAKFTRKLEKCTSCGKKISVLAETCPSCGAPNESKEIVEKNSNAAVWSMLSIVFILFLLFHCELGISLEPFSYCS
ncbi:hypothetical protein N9682_03850 [Candidatus Pelagibacter sp.]|nr:hypothetical protein [Candidatus Pelagibacter sp.]